MLANEAAYARVRRLPIESVIVHARNQPLPVVDEFASLDDILAAWAKFPCCHNIFVTSSTGGFCGIVPVEILNYFVSKEGRHPHVSLNSGRQKPVLRAHEVMAISPLLFTVADSVGSVLLKLCCGRHRDEIPIVDADEKLVAVISSLELLQLVRKCLNTEMTMVESRRRTKRFACCDR